MRNSLTKYKIGLLVIGVLTIGIVIAVMVQAGATKQDNVTYKKANRIADALNTYVTNNGVPSSLAAAHISDVPSTISYSKSGDSYEFCVTYRANSDGFDASTIGTDLLSAGLGGGTSSSDSSSASTPDYLYLDTTHHKGKNCQTIKPYVYSDNYNSSSTSSSNQTDVPASTGDCNIDINGQQTTDKVYFACLDKQTN